MYSGRIWKKWGLVGIIVAGWSVAFADQPITVAMITQFSLSGVEQVSDSSMGSVRISNKDILAALNATGRFDFGNNAQIVLLSVDGNLPSIGVRERSGTNVITTDISSYFYITEPMEVHAAGDVAGFAIYVFNFDNHNGTSFRVLGETTLHAGTIIAPGGGQLFRDKTLSSTVYGSGAVNGATIVVRGTVHGGSAKAEID
jgi:hypothetical protein